MPTASRGSRPRLPRRLPPASWVPLSFAAAILVGTLLLRLPAATPPDRPIGWVDALFTSTSATCVTGLIVRDTGSGFTGFGQACLLALMQAGGLGIMTLWLVFLVGGSRASVEQRELVDRSLAGGRSLGPRQLLRLVVAFTLICETVGAAALWLGFRGRLPGAAWQAVFHSVSAFCNAGFSLLPDSLEGFRASPIVNVAVAGLIVLGGLGFLTVEDLVRTRLRWRPLSLHSKLVLTVSAGLLVLVAAAFWLLERPQTLAGMPAGEQLAASLFQSVTARTAGFATVDFGSLAPATLWLIMIAMTIGGSPGSCAGGIKTTTAAVLALGLRAELAGRRHVNAFGRTLPRRALAAAFAVTAAALASAALGLGALLVLEGPAAGARFLDYAFETVSALGTVGLSTGVTPSLEPSSRLVLALLMFLGRVGPLTLAASLAARRVDDWRHPTEAVMIG